MLAVEDIPLFQKLIDVDDHPFELLSVAGKFQILIRIVFLILSHFLALNNNTINCVLVGEFWLVLFLDLNSVLDWVVRTLYFYAI